MVIDHSSDSGQQEPDQNFALLRHVRRVPPSTLRANTRNARTHSKKQVAQIAGSIKSFGFINPILVDEHETVLAGHGRLAAAKLLGLDEVPVLRIDGLSEAQKRAYVLADNKLAEKAGWDRGMLAIELGDLATLLPPLDLDVTLTGFEAGEIDLILADHGASPSAPEDAAPALREQAVSRAGDLWILNQHRVLCGDARSEAALDQLMGTEQAAMVFADPPYNVPVAGHVQGRARVKHREFAFASGEMSEAEFATFLRTSLGNVVRRSVSGAVHYICMDWRHITDLITVGRAIYAEMLNLCVWAKTNAGQGSFYRSQHELVTVFRVGTDPHQNNVNLGRLGRNRSNLWTYAGVNSFGKDREDALAAHPTVKPVPLVADAMRDCTTRGDCVVDPFLGSGTTLVAAEKVGRRCYGIEYEPAYVDVAIRRWQAFTGRDAVRECDGLTFDEIEAQQNVVGEAHVTKDAGTAVAGVE